MRFPLTRPIARRRARTLFDLVAGFTYSQVLSACVETQLLDMLADGPQSAETLAQRTDLPIGGIMRLLRAAATLGLVEPVGPEWALGTHGAALRGNPGINEVIAHHHLLYADLADPVGLLRRGGGGGRLARHWHYAGAAGKGRAEEVADYSALMAASQPLVAQQILDAYPFDRHRRLLDVGGGEGAFLASVARRHPSLRLGLIDLPAVADRARARLDEAGLTSVAVTGGDFLRDPLPEGYDLISLVRILHDHDDGPAMALLRNIHAALPPGGTLLLAEPMAGTPGAEAAGDAYFGFYLLAMGSGRPRSARDIKTMVNEAGFAHARSIATHLPLTVNLVTARKP